MCFFLNKKVHLLVSELYIYQNARCNTKNWIMCWWAELLLNSRGNPYNTDLVSSVYMPLTASCHSEVSVPLYKVVQI